MRAIWVGGAVLFVSIVASASPGTGQQPTDTRQLVVVAPAARGKILAEMRGMLGALHEVRAFDALADQLRGGATGEEALKSIAALTGNCVACHAMYRLGEAR